MRLRVNQRNCKRDFALVESKSIGSGSERDGDAVDSDDSEDDTSAHIGNHIPATRRNDWSSRYDRVHKRER